MKIENLKLKIVFFGSSKFVIPIIEVLRKNFDLKLVLTTEKNPADPIPSYCIRSKVYHYVVIDFKDKKLLQKLTELNADLAVLASFGAIVPSKILNIFPHGIINIHPSLLPKYRGPTPAQAAILNGEKTTGVTIIKLDEEVDHGPILFQKEEEIYDSDTNESLYERLFKIASNSIVQTIELYLKEKIIPKEQNHKKATFTTRLNRRDGFVDIQKPPSAPRLNRMIRAYYPWPGVWTKLRTSNKELRIKFLPYKKIQVENKKPITYKDFVNGYPKELTQPMLGFGILDL